MLRLGFQHSGLLNSLCREITTVAESAAIVRKPVVPQAGCLLLRTLPKHLVVEANGPQVILYWQAFIDAMDIAHGFRGH